MHLKCFLIILFASVVYSKKWKNVFPKESLGYRRAMDEFDLVEDPHLVRESHHVFNRGEDLKLHKSELSGIVKKEPHKLPTFLLSGEFHKIQSNEKNIETNSGNFFIYDRNMTLPNHGKKEASRARKNKIEYFVHRRSSSDLSPEEDYENDIMEGHLKHRIPRAVTAKKERIWDHAVIPFDIDNIFSSSHKALFKQAMRHWENFTCIKFVERDPKVHPNYIYFTVRNCGCCSFVGKRGNGRQTISIGRNCEKFGIVVHELGHVIGFWHAHTRIDRDKHIAIHKGNIMKGQEYNFNVLTAEEVTSQGLPYDYNSIMHYAKNTFSKSVYLDTIVPIGLEGNQRPEMGQRTKLSKGDIAQANLLYKCPTCGRTFQQKSGHIVTPNFYLLFDKDIPSERCEWSITATNGERIILRIQQLTLFETENCELDFLEVRDGYWHKSPIIKKLCGNITAESITTYSSRMLITYVNNNVINGFRGFKADFEVKCGGEIYLSENRKIDSPNYPLEYLPDKECIWTVITPEKHQVALRFQSFELENHDKCLYDYVEIRDGGLADSELIGVFCGYKLPPNIKTTSNKMFIKFVSDSSVQKIGFVANLMKEFDECKYTNHGCEQECINTLGSFECTCFAGYELQSNGKTCEGVCGGVVNVTAGNNATVLTSPWYPHFYPAAKDCVWEIVAPPKHSLSIQFKEFDVEGTKYTFTDCGFDFVTIYSKLKGNRLNKLGVFCGSDLPPTLFSEHNALRIEFHSDDSVQHQGFVAELVADFDECQTRNGGCQHFCKNVLGGYKCSCRKGYTLHEDGHDCVETECKYEISNSYGIINSPNYPEMYPKNTYCYWHFSTTPGHRVHLTFQEFDVESHQECYYDYVAVHDGKSENSSSLGVFCGDERPYTIVASTNHLFLVLKTDGGLQKKGFTATYATVCGGYLRATNETQLFYSHPKFGSAPYKRNMYCKWKIEADYDRSVKIQFTFFDIEYSKKCNYDFVQISEEFSYNPSLSEAKYCGNQKPPNIISQSDALTIEFQTDGTTSMEGFSIAYREVEPLPEVTDDEMSTPFPGYAKRVYYTSRSNYDDDYDVPYSNSNDYS